MASIWHKEKINIIFYKYVWVAIARRGSTVKFSAEKTPSRQLTTFSGSRSLSALLSVSPSFSLLLQHICLICRALKFVWPHSSCSCLPSLIIYNSTFCGAHELCFLESCLPHFLYANSCLQHTNGAKSSEHLQICFNTRSPTRAPRQQTSHFKFTFPIDPWLIPRISHSPAIVAMLPLASD